MASSLLRNKRQPEEVYDPVSAAAWAAGAVATARVVELLTILKFSLLHGHHADPLRAQLKTAAALTPCAIDRDARTKPPREWTFDDYLLTVQVAEALRKIIVDGLDAVPQGEFSLFDTKREVAAVATVAFVDTIEIYTKLVRRERSMERISGTDSLRRGLGRRKTVT